MFPSYKETNVNSISFSNIAYKLLGLSTKWKLLKRIGIILQIKSIRSNTKLNPTAA